MATSIAPQLSYKFSTSTSVKFRNISGTRITLRPPVTSKDYEVLPGEEVEVEKEDVEVVRGLTHSGGCCGGPETPKPYFQQLED